MHTHTDPNLLEFAARMLENHDAITEHHASGLSVLLPHPLAQALNLPEETMVGDEEHPLFFGSPVLERLIGLSTQTIPVAYGQIEVPYLKKDGFENVLQRELTFQECKFTLSSRAQTRANYLIVNGSYTALSDERKEGLIDVAVRENGAAIIQGFEKLWRSHTITYYSARDLPPHFPQPIEKALEQALKEVRLQAAAVLSPFISSMERRLQRDAANTREYYAALKREMEAGLARISLSAAQIQERREKINGLPLEEQRKISDLEQKYKIQVRIKGCGMTRLLVDVVQIMLNLQYRKLSRSVSLLWNPVTRRMDPFVCEQCQTSVIKIHPRPEGNSFRLVCDACVEAGTKNG